eukprot:TRINITY_DN7913_c0_g2_i1.p1 TRINITY_DN7913_c0_g2~~TRINITY_DN7913_c0_g2_i1.p1  ORF type:complete len:455 (+),score=153.03 TRINITY_DN7913_c0_g2_i1:130-1494(+)
MKMIRTLCLYHGFIIFALLISKSVSDDQQFGPSSIVDDCCCPVNKLERANSAEVKPLLDEIVSRRFFQYFKLDLFTDCAFWPTDCVCGSEGCAIGECGDDEIPRFWDQQKTDKVDVALPKNFVGWSDEEADMWLTPASHAEQMSYVNLVKYPERNTGYDKEGRIVWEAIYNENCFTGAMDSMCLEERVFYRLVSGLHASINTHVYRFFEGNSTNGEQWQPTPHSIRLFERNILAYPERIKNLYFAYLFLLRAVHKIAPVLEQYDYNTGRPADDHETRELMRRLLRVDLLCSPNFDESVLFTDPVMGEQLREQFRVKFHNISLIMNCVTCEKCKVWAKVQTLAIGTALKILLAADINWVFLHLQRNEIIALVNTLRQFATSIDAVQHMSDLAAIVDKEESSVCCSSFVSNFLSLPCFDLPFSLVFAAVASLVALALFAVFEFWRHPPPRARPKAD